jgi:hypothetical protein
MNSLRLVKGSIHGIVKLGSITAPIPPTGYNTHLYTLNQETNCFVKLKKKKVVKSRREIKINKFLHILDQFQSLDHIPESETLSWKTIITDYQMILQSTPISNQTDEIELSKLISYYTQFTSRLNQVFESLPQKLNL